MPLSWHYTECLIVPIGRFQKISIPYHGRLLGFPTGRGGSRLWNSEGMGGGGGYCAFFNQGNVVFDVLIRKIKVQSSIIMWSVLVAIARVSILSL